MGTNVQVWIERTAGADVDLAAMLERATSDVFPRHARFLQWSGRADSQEAWHQVGSSFGVVLEGRGLTCEAHRGLVGLLFRFRWSGFVENPATRVAVLDLADAVGALVGGRRAYVLPDSTAHAFEDADVESFAAFAAAVEAVEGPPAASVDELDPRADARGRRHCVLELAAGG